MKNIHEYTDIVHTLSFLVYITILAFFFATANALRAIRRALGFFIVGLCRDYSKKQNSTWKCFFSPGCMVKI